MNRAKIKVGKTETTIPQAIKPYGIALAVMKASAPTVTGCIWLEPNIRAKTKLFQA